MDSKLELRNRGSELEHILLEIQSVIEEALDEPEEDTQPDED